ncbi:hypothetical protein BU251_05605 [Candidatus Velamenicoccus archaeovorus]|uniref:Uncharacterized protein n=1 Tax=Velamenicoccus archaeovorus TaxID=1930593 RepID=A0A410P4X8_VELA1|nr:hypothetical protein BU251_05605 [Candidatus Velamenicoccus archaeovorus]
MAASPRGADLRIHAKEGPAQEGRTSASMLRRVQLSKQGACAPIPKDFLEEGNRFFYALLSQDIIINIY